MGSIEVVVGVAPTERIIARWIISGYKLLVRVDAKRRPYISSIKKSHGFVSKAASIAMPCMTVKAMND